MAKAKPKPRPEGLTTGKLTTGKLAAATSAPFKYLLRDPKTGKVIPEEKPEKKPKPLAPGAAAAGTATEAAQVTQEQTLRRIEGLLRPPPPKPRRKTKAKDQPPEPGETVFLTASVYPSGGIWTLPGQPGKMRLKSAVIQGVVLGSGAPPRAFALRLFSGGTPFFSSFASADAVGNADTVEVSFGGGLTQGILHLGDQHYTQSGLPTDGIEITENGGVQIQMIGYQSSDTTPNAVFSYLYTL